MEMRNLTRPVIWQASSCLSLMRPPAASGEGETGPACPLRARKKPLAGREAKPGAQHVLPAAQTREGERQEESQWLRVGEG